MSIDFNGWFSSKETLGEHKSDQNLVLNTGIVLWNIPIQNSIGNRPLYFISKVDIFFNLTDKYIIT